MKPCYDTFIEPFTEAYKAMSLYVKYRPQAPSDGMGSLLMTKKEIENPDILDLEAKAYARELAECDYELEWTLHGCLDYKCAKVFVYIFNAATLCFSGEINLVKKLLQLALLEIENTKMKKRV
jgi:hypothetical protein